MLGGSFFEVFKLDQTVLIIPFHPQKLYIMVISRGILNKKGTNSRVTAIIFLILKVNVLVYPSIYKKVFFKKSHKMYFIEFTYLTKNIV